MKEFISKKTKTYGLMHVIGFLVNIILLIVLTNILKKYNDEPEIGNAIYAIYTIIFFIIVWFLFDIKFYLNLLKGEISHVYMLLLIILGIAYFFCFLAIIIIIMLMAYNMPALEAIILFIISAFEIYILINNIIFPRLALKDEEVIKLHTYSKELKEEGIKKIETDAYFKRVAEARKKEKELNNN